MTVCRYFFDAGLPLPPATRPSPKPRSAKSPTARQRAGQLAEQQAEQMLTSAGLRVVARNWRCRLGELDLICREGAEMLVFVEVRSRQRSDFGSAAESITAHKQARMIAAARHYLAQLAVLPPCRFDVVLLEGGNPPRWLRHVIEL